MASTRAQAEQVATRCDAFVRLLGDLRGADMTLVAAERRFEDERMDPKKNGALEAWGRMLDYSCHEPAESFADRIFRENHGNISRAEFEYEASECARLQPFRDAIDAARSARDALRNELANAARQLTRIAIQLGVADTRSLHLFHQTWEPRDIFDASALVEHIQALASVSGRQVQVPDELIAPIEQAKTLGWKDPGTQPTLRRLARLRKALAEGGFELGAKQFKGGGHKIYVLRAAWLQVAELLKTALALSLPLRDDGTVNTSKLAKPHSYWCSRCSDVTRTDAVNAACKLCGKGDHLIDLSTRRGGK